MFNGRFATHHWIILWGIIAIMANSIGTAWGSWAAVAAAIFSGLGIGYAVHKWLRRKRKLRNAFDASYNPPMCGKQHVYPGEKQQGVQLQLRVDVYVKSIKFQFIPQSNNTPSILKLYDPDSIIQVPEGISINNISSGEIEWRYNNPPHQRVDSIIKVGIEYIASKSFSGNLRICLTVDEGDKEKCLPFSVCGEKGDG